jgi:hypothetical protein
MSKDCDSERPSFGAHLGDRNAERLHLASCYFAAVMLALIVTELIAPALWSAELILVQAASGLYFCGLAWVCREGRAATWSATGPATWTTTWLTTWPTPALPLLFGVGTIATGLLLSLNLASRFGATPAYATTVFVACLAPLWPRRALLSISCRFTASISRRCSPVLTTSSSKPS